MFILHLLRNKLLQLVLIYFDSASWEIHQFLYQTSGPLKIPMLNQTKDSKIARLMLYLVTKDITKNFANEIL